MFFDSTVAMSPANEMKSSKHESKSKIFSFRWFFHKSKSSSQSSKDVALQATVPLSKSCDTSLEPIDRYPKYLLWKLLPGKSTAQTQYCQRALPFRSSFSCNDVHSLSPTNQNFHATNSGFKSTLGVMVHPCQSLYYLCKSHNGLSSVDTEKMLFINPEELSNDSKTILCKLCLANMPINSMYTLQECSCMFCLVCLYQYLNINIREGKIPITCPDANCSLPGNILESEIKEIAGNDALALFEKYKLNLDVELDPSKVWCPAPGCETVCEFQPSKDSNAGTSVNCANCRLKFCSLCKLRWHGRTSCQEAKKASREDSDLSMSDEENWIKQCPNCRIPIEKDEGCAQMMCYRCKHVFCWHCLASLDDDFLLRHYDKGPCRNKLGHSRASMVWHRTQVIGIFAGFSFLLLMASPFLLIAAPCLICCRCKNKILYEEATKL